MRLISARQANAIALPKEPAHRAAKRNGWHQIYRGVYLDLQAQKISHEALHAARVMAASSASPGSVISGASAAVLHGLPLLSSRIPTQVHVTRHHKSDNNRWVIAHQANFATDEVVTVSGIRCTSIARTIQDLAGHLGLHELLALADAALARGIDLTPLSATRRHCRKLRWVSEHASDRSESFAESWSRFILITSGASVPMLQPTVYGPDGQQIGRVDFATEGGLLGEFDGKLKYDRLLQPGETAADAVMAEKQRENALRDAQFEVVRWDWSLLKDPPKLLERWRLAQLRVSKLPQPTGTLKLLPMHQPKVPNWTAGITWAN